MEKLTREQITEKLKEMKVGPDGYTPFKLMMVIVENPDYDIKNYSQRIEDGEAEVNIFDEYAKKLKDSNFDYIWNNTLKDIPYNSDEWMKNHSKKCKYKIGGIFNATSVMHVDGTRDYYSYTNMEEIMKIAKECGSIYDIM